MEHKPFYFIGNILDPKITAPLLIKQGYEIKKANPSQIKIIRTKLDNIQEISQNTFSYANPYESDIIYVENEKYYQIEKIENENELKYWILEIDCSIDDYDKNIKTIIKNYEIIDKAFLLSELNIQLLWGFLHYHVSDKEIYVDAISSPNYRPLNYIKNISSLNNVATPLKSDEFEDIKSYVIRIEQLCDNEKYQIFQKVMNDLVSYFEIPPKSPFRIIGLFAILEYLLTTNESGKSINKQLQTKLNLLNNRFPNKMNISDFFKISDGFKFEKIIEKLYAYRSDIAHGNPIDFENKLQILNNILLVENFLLTLVRRTIRQALFEPDLIIDLKKC